MKKRNNLFLLAMWVLPFCSLQSSIDFSAYLMSVSAFERHSSQDQLRCHLTCGQVLHLRLCIEPHQAEDRERPSLPTELTGCNGWGRRGDVINAACTPTTE